MDYMTDGANSSQIFVPAQSPGGFFSTFVARVNGRAFDRRQPGNQRRPSRFRDGILERSPDERERVARAPDNEALIFCCAPPKTVCGTRRDARGCL
jgi:hypothetical protein